MSKSIVCVFLLILSCNISLFAGLSVSQTDSDTTVQELGVSDSIIIAADNAPTATVWVQISASSPDIEINGGFAGDDAIISITSAGWTSPTKVTLVAADDGIQESIELITLSFTVSSTDPSYNAISIPDINVIVLDRIVDFCPDGDIDGDCAVTISDLNILAAQWLSSPNCTGIGCADVTDPGFVDLLDFEKVTSKWNKAVGPIVINEFMADNNSDNPDINPEDWEVFDESGDSVDWIELWNISSEPVNLTGWHMTDNRGELDKWQFPDNKIIPAGEFLIIYASGDEHVSGSFIHTNFSLTAGGEYLALIDPEGITTSEYIEYEFDSDKFGYPPQESNVSYGYTDYMQSQRYFYPATPGWENNNSSLGTSPDTKFTVDRGFFDAPFELNIYTNNSDAVVKYTIDGSTPGWSNGIELEPDTTITIDKTTTLRARSFLPGYLPSNVDTQTYIFLADVIHQQPDGSRPSDQWPYPGYSVNSQRFDYGMDPDVVNNPEYADLMDDALLAVPTMSMVIDSEYMFDPSTGIYVNAEAARSDNDFWTVEKEKACSLELINPDGSDGFNINCGVRIRGGASRNGGNPKHAFRFFFRNIYGKGKLEYPLFDDEGVDEYDKIDLRTSQNFSWAFKGDYQNFHNTMCREVFSRDIQGKLGHPYTKSRYYHLYINGVYWGLYQTQERAESRFAASYMGGSKTDYDVIKADYNYGRQMLPAEGNRDAFQRLWEAVADGVYTTEEYYRLQGMNPDGTINPNYERLLDVTNLIDYQLINYYTSDTDGAASRFGNLPNNIFCLYNRTNPDGWKWLEHDSEHSMGISELGWPHFENLVTPYTTAGAQSQYFNPHWMHEQMIQQNAEYRMAFADRVQELFFNDGLFTPDKVWDLIVERGLSIELAIIAESARWGDANSNPPRTRDTWYQAMYYLQDFIFGESGYQWETKPRQQRVLEQFIGENWLCNLSAPDFNLYGGYVPNNFNLEISNPNDSGQIYFTTDGSDPRLPADDNSAIADITLIAESDTKYVMVPGSELGLINTDNSLIAETWSGIGGVTIPDLTNNSRYPSQPDNITFWDDFEMPKIDYLDNYGTRVRGYLYPPVSGNYNFWISSDDYGQLLLSTDASADNASVIASVPGWSNSYEWFKFSQQESDSIYLNAGQKYYIEALQKEEGGGDNLAIAWSGPTINGPVVIDSRYLLPSGQPWTCPEFDHSSWTAGNNAVGYDRDSSGTYVSLLSGGINVESDMYDTNTSCYVRIPFQYNNETLTQLQLTLRYEDAVVVFLNGVEVLRDNVDESTGPLTWNSHALNARSDNTAIVPVSFDLSGYTDLLINGTNILAIQIMNNILTSSDLILTAELTGSERQLSAGEPSDSAQIYSNPLSLQKSMDVKARIYDGKQWSAMTKATFAISDINSNLRVTEIMYHPDEPDTEYIELKNIGSESINLDKVRFTKGIDFDFGDIVVPADSYILLVENQTAFEAKYGTGLPVIGTYTGSFSNGKDNIRIKDALDAVLLEFEYQDWYEITDGDGFSLTIADETISDTTLLSEKESWRPSTENGGSPGKAESYTLPNIGDIVINEVLAHSHATAPDWIELHNTTDSTINIGGWFLSDSNSDDTAKMKFEIPLGTTIIGGGYKVFYETLHFGNANAEGCHTPFGLSEGGETLYLHSGYDGQLTGYQVEEDFGASASNVAFGRYYKASTDSWNFVAMDYNTPGEDNSYPKVGPIVISEIMYNPEDGGAYDNDDYEYIKLTNITNSTVNLWLYDDINAEYVGWKLTNGIEFSFAANDSIAPYSSIVVVRNIDAFKDRYPSVPLNTIYGPYDGGLNNKDDKIDLVMPGDKELDERYYIRIDRVSYLDDTPWPDDADGEGDSLHRIDNSAYGNDPANWQAAAPNP